MRFENFRENDGDKQFCYQLKGICLIFGCKRGNVADKFVDTNRFGIVFIGGQMHVIAKTALSPIASARRPDW